MAAWASFDEGKLEEAIQLTRQSLEQASEDRPHAYAALGWFLLSAGSTEEALVLLASSVGRYPEHAPFHWYLGLLHQKEHRLEDACQALMAAVAFDPNLDEAAVSLAWVLGDLHRFEEAEHYARHALSIKNQPERLAQLGWFLLAQDKWEAAAEQLAQALSQQPKNAETRSQLATALQKLGRRDEALKVLSGGLALSENTPALLQQRVRLLLELRQPDDARETVERLLFLAPDDVTSHTLASVVFENNGELLAASDHAEKAVACDDTSADAWRALAQVRIRQERLSEAAHALRTVLNLDPNNTSDTYRQLGWICINESRNEDAIVTFTAAVENNANDASSWYGLAQAHQIVGNFAEALAAINTALKLRNGWLDALVLRGNILIAQGPDTWNDAVSQLSDALSLQPERTETRCLLSMALQRLDRRDESLQVLADGLRIVPEASDLLRLQTSSLLDLGRTENAHMACRRLIRQQPQEGMGWYLLAMVFEQNKRPGMALRALARARRCAPALPDAWLRTGWLALGKGDTRTAREAVTRLLDLAPEAFTSQLLASAVLECSGELQAAAGHAENAIARDAQSAAAWRALAQARARQDRLVEAEAALHEAIDREPKNTTDAYRQLGWVYIKDHRFVDAIAAFSSAVEGNANDAPSWYGLAEANRAVGRFIDALTAIKNALQLRHEWNDQRLRGQIIHEQIHNFLYRKSHKLDASSHALRESRPPSPNPPARYDYVLCSLSTKSHLHLMRTLAASARQHFVGDIYLLVLDSDDTSLVPEGTKLVRRDDVITPAVWNEMVQRYNVLELCCALKSYLMRFLAKTVNRPIIYLDADTYLMAPLERLLPENPHFSVFLTPHLLAPMPDKRHADEIVMLAVGAYNAGMLAVGLHPDGIRFLDWWLDRVTRYAYDSREQAVFTDQKWLDLVPSFFRNVQVCQEIGLNVGHWQVQSEQDFAEDPEGKLTFHGERVTLMHLSGFKPDKPELLASHISPPMRPDSALGRFLRKYALETLHHKQPSQ